ncbi:MAG TPA: hypothetical protein VI146_05990 [Nitrososphaeraceae archaeon]
MMDAIRNGNFTSSEIVALTTNGNAKGSFGKPFYTYIEECNMERRLGMALENEIDAKPTSWGKLIEKRPFEKLSTEYHLCSSETLSHPTIDFWKGSPDLKKYSGNDLIAIGDLKCPMTRKSFCQLVDPYYEDGNLIYEALTIEAVRANHKDGEKYFWQIVSNAAIAGAKKGELIVYIPYKSELEEIRTLASSAGEMGEYSKWIYFATDEQLPHILEGGHYKSINIIEFDILPRDVDFITERVKEGGKLLTKR